MSRLGVPDHGLARFLWRARRYPRVAFDGWYGSVGWLLTGETRNYDGFNGTLQGVTPTNPLSAGGPGAWEVALRLGEIDLTDHDVTGGIQRTLTAGVNWYPTRNIRLQFNYASVLETSRPGHANDGLTPSIYQLRAQLRF